jgi:putative membrane protein
MRYKALIVGIALVTAAVASPRAQGGDQAFVTKLAGVGMAEVELGTFAKDKASSREVKAFAQRMIDDHTKAGDELKAVAQRKHYTLPSAIPADAVALKDKLSKLNGAAFDRAYIDAMVDGHRAALAEVKTEAQSGSDPDVKAWATKASSTVQAHLTHAQNQQRELSKAATN